MPIWDAYTYEKIQAEIALKRLVELERRNKLTPEELVAELTAEKITDDKIYRKLSLIFWIVLISLISFAAWVLFFPEVHILGL
jgi:hypothetical protein